MEKDKYQVVVAMSGGVDSSMAALMLLEQGYHVHGVFLRTWRPDQSGSDYTEIERSAIESAKFIANKYQFPFHVFDVRDRFREKVIGYFVDTYLNARTPNPCIYCNRNIKWDALLEIADRLGAHFVATGHYARTNKLSNGIVQLVEARDSTKDQVYFLSNLTQKELSRTLFPNGEYLKSEIREIARQKGLEIADRSDSQDLCFLENRSYSEFLLQYGSGGLAPGQFVSTEGSVLGEHKGLALYTIGQRKGLGISSSRPFYVIEKILNKNQIVIGHEEDLGKDEALLRNLHWIAGESPSDLLHLEVKIRYKTKKKQAVLVPFSHNRYKLKFEEKLRDITPGQFAVFYDGNIVTGNAEII